MPTIATNDNRYGCFALSPKGAREPQCHREGPGSRHQGQPVDPVFLMLRPDAMARQIISRLAYFVRDKHRLKGWPLGQDRFHITLCGFCEFADLTDDMVAAIGDAVTSVGMPPFLIGLDYVEKFLSGAVVLRSDNALAGVEMFRNELVRGLRRHGFDIGKKTYVPHLTLLYDPRPVATQAVEEIRWTARECVLVHSPQGESRHIPIAQWPLSLRVAHERRGRAVELVAARGGD